MAPEEQKQKETTRGVEAEVPSDAPDVRRVEAEETAGGMGAVWATVKHAWSEMGVFRSLQTLRRINQDGGFDCPGCAWPEPGDRHSAEFCENGAKAVADEATLKRVGLEFFRTHPVGELSKKSDHWLGKQGRLTHPMVLWPGEDHYLPIDWDDAFDLLARHLNELTEPDEAVFYTSGRTSNEAAFLYQLFVRQFGTNNLPDCSNMCHESSGTGLGEAIGVGKGTVTLEDFEEADAIFIIGQNPGTNHPRMLTTLQAAARNGCRIVTINPLREPALVRFSHPQEVSGLAGRSTAISELYLQVRINGDVALLKGIMKAMLEEEDRRPGEILDHAFIDEHTSGFEAFAEALREVSWDTIVEESGIDRTDIERAARVAMESERVICCWAMGLTQHKNGVANIQEVVNFLLLRGNIGKPGAGACPVRGHSNVQGDRTMGIWERPSEAFLDALGREFDFEPPREPGLATVHAIKAMHDGRAKVFVAMGGNFLSATPDTAYTAEALSRCRLTVQISTKLNRSHLVTGETALILPCLGRTERDTQPGGTQFVSVENSMGIVHSSRGKLPPASEHLLSEPRIVARMARATLGDETTVAWEELADDYDRIRDRIARVVPGFEEYNVRVRQPGGFLLPNSARDRDWKTENGKARFTVHEIPEHGLEPDELLMMTVRSHDQYNTTIYGLDDRYRGIKNGRRVVFLHPEDMEKRGIVEGQRIDLVSHYEGEERVASDFVAIPFEIPRRCAATYFPEANVLVPVDSMADKSHTPTSKSIVITLR